MRKIQGVVLDLDGTFIDSNDARAQAWAEALKESGYPIAFSEVRALVGLVPHEVLTRTVGFGEDTDGGRKIRDRYRHIFLRRYVSRLVPTFRAVDLLAQLERDGVKLGVASIDPPEVLVPLLRILGAEALVHRSAYAPEGAILTNRDLLKQALDKIGVQPARGALIADAPHDIEAASKLGLVTVAVASGGFSQASLRGALAVYPDVRTLLSSYDASPFAALQAAG